MKQRWMRMSRRRVKERTTWKALLVRWRTDRACRQTDRQTGLVERVCQPEKVTRRGRGRESGMDTVQYIWRRIV